LDQPDRYLITKVRSLDGFYGVTMRKGYLDRMDPEVDWIVERICAIERRFSGERVEARLEEIRVAGRMQVHMWVVGVKSE
jgi:KUP system potassium uptake protein